MRPGCGVESDRENSIVMVCLRNSRGRCAVDDLRMVLGGKAR
jgi:hypothetical protein